MSDASDIGNVYAYTVCENLTTGTTYDFNVWLSVPAGVTVYLLDESFSGIEIEDFSITEGYVAPIPNSITSPSNGSYVKDTISVTWLEFVDPNDDLSYYNITLQNSDGSHNSTINGSATDLSQDFDTTTVEDGDYKIQVEAVDGQSLTSSTVHDIIIDNTAPVVTINSPLNTSYTLDTIDDSGLIDLDISMSETVLQMDYSLNGEVNITFETDASTFVGTILVPEADNNSLMICGTDYAFNEACVVRADYSDKHRASPVRCRSRRRWLPYRHKRTSCELHIEHRHNSWNPCHSVWIRNNLQELFQQVTDDIII
jgi:hypothetical protein